MLKIGKVEVDQIKEWNNLANHPLQTWEWGEFRQAMGTKVARWGVYSFNKVNGSFLAQIVQITIHPIPHTPFSIGYYPKGGKINQEVVKILEAVAKEYQCIYIKCEPKIEVDEFGTVDFKQSFKKMGFKQGRSLFTPHNFVLNVTPAEDELLTKMKAKTRYNIRLAKKRGVVVKIDNSLEAFKRYLELTEETTRRQGFWAHSKKYHQIMWKVLHKAGLANLIVAKYKQEIVTTWILFQHKDTLYYPYGASTRNHRNLMANNLVMWEVIRWAKKQNLKYVDMWGALGKNPNKSNPWYGFHKFKAGYGAKQVTYVGSWDYVAKPIWYYPLRGVEWIRQKWLKLRRH